MDTARRPTPEQLPRVRLFSILYVDLILIDLPQNLPLYKILSVQRKVRAEIL